MFGLAQIVFWTCAAILFYVYVGYPALLALIGAFVHREKPAPDYEPTLSVLIAAYNEQANIGRKIEQTLALDYPADKIEILVLSDGSSDRTDEIVRRLSRFARAAGAGFRSGTEKRTPRTKECAPRKAKC